MQRLQPGAQTLDAALYEVIVTDDAADPATKQLLQTQFPWATYTPGPQRGPAANRNHGAKLATATWLVFTDDDCLPDAHWLQAYADAVQQHPSCKAFEGAIWPDDWDLLKKDMAECPVNTEGGAFWSANIMVEQTLFNELGGFDEQFKMAAQEDQDLQWRLSQITTIAFVAKAQVVHPVRRQPFFFAEKNKWLRLQSLVYRKRKEGMNAAAVYGISISGVFRALVDACSKRKYQQSFHLACHFLYQLIALPIILLSTSVTSRKTKMFIE